MHATIDDKVNIRLETTPVNALRNDLKDKVHVEVPSVYFSVFLQTQEDSRMAGLDSNDEIRRLDQLIDEGTDETLESTRRILQTVKKTNQIGVETLVKLNEQG